jgi:glycosyltransferase involved in cell wall biosynthesis
MWEQYRNIKTPLLKRVFINGWSDDMPKHVGPIPNDLNVTTFEPYETDIKPFLDKCHLIVQSYPNGESWGRSVAEAWSCGVPTILSEGNNAFAEMGENGKHFLSAKTSLEMANLASELAIDSERMKELSTNARIQLEQHNGNKEICTKFWNSIL